MHPLDVIIRLNREQAEREYRAALAEGTIESYERAARIALALMDDDKRQRKALDDAHYHSLRQIAYNEWRKRNENVGRR